MDTDPESEGEEYWTLGEFMEEHYSQFAIMGIFGTVSVFLSNNPPEGMSTIVARTGTFASLVIFALAAIWIFNHALGIFFNEFDSTHRPLPTELGFITLVLCTGAIIISIGVAIQNYSEIFTIAIRISAVVIVSVVYLRRFPTDRMSVGEKSAGDIAPAGFLVVFLIYSVFADGIDILLTQYTDGGVTRLILMTTGAGVLHLFVSESLKGYLKLLYEFELTPAKNSLADLIYDRKIPEWAFSISICVTAVGFTLYSAILYWIFKVAREASGYYAILGVHWESFVIYHLFAISSIVCLKMMTDSDNYEGYLLGRVNPFLLAAALLILFSVEIVLIHFGQLGYQVIEF